MLICADLNLIDHVLSNLISNAVKYSGRSRRIEISVLDLGAAVELSVHDHGVGIPDNEVPKLFARFYRASTAAGISGTGIGLYLVREIVALHGGDIRVESKLGEGSHFIVTLPRAVLEERRISA